MSLNDPSTIYLGVDIDKSFLQIDTSVLPKLQPRIPNTAAGFKVLIKAIQKLSSPVHVVFEPSGGYERPLKDALHQADIRLSLVHANRIRCFIQACGVFAKTDAIDSSMITRFGERMQPAATKSPTPTQRDLQELTERRAQLVKLHVMEQNRFPTHRHPAIIKSAKATLDHLKKQIEQMDALLQKLTVEDEELQYKVKRLGEIQGVGPITALGVLAAMPELGLLNRREVASLGGLAPRNQDSGAKQGRRYIGGGRAGARRSLYMAAVSASRCNPVLAPFYQKLRAQGKSAKTALTAVMRKLLCVMNTMLKNPEFKLE